MTHNPLWFGLIALFACRPSDSNVGSNTARWSCEETECACDDGTVCADSQDCAQACIEE